MTVKLNTPPHAAASAAAPISATFGRLSRVECEHTRINEMLRKAMQAFMRQASPSEVNAILLELSGYTLAHFREEEELMRSCAFPGLNVHKQEHDLMAQDIRGLLDIRSKQEALRSAVGALELWLNAHIRIKDKEFRDFVLQQAK